MYFKLFFIEILDLSKPLKLVNNRKYYTICKAQTVVAHGEFGISDFLVKPTM